jgi:putative tricarboxylic transport membrane protein
VRREAWCAVALLILAAVLYAATTRIEGNPLVAIGPDFYPRLLVALLAVLAVCLPVVSPRAEPGGTVGNQGLVIGIFLIFIAYAMALPWVGFRLATFAFLAVMRVVLGPVSGLRGWLGVVLFAVLGTLLAWYVFEQHLMVLLPRGSLSGF